MAQVELQPLQGDPSSSGSFMAQVELQPLQDDPSSSNSNSNRSNTLPEFNSSLSSSSLFSELSPSHTPISAARYSMLINNDTQGFLEQTPNVAELVSESDNSSILHLAASVGQLNFIDFVIRQHQHLLTQPNSNKDLPIHVAARASQLEAIKRLVSWAQFFGEISMLERENNDKNTALHIALENQQEEMAKFLFEKCPQNFYHLNEQKISPLYLGIKAEFWELVKSMLSENIALRDPKDEAEGVLLKGKSVVHAAILAKKKDILEMMVEEYNDLLYEKTDEMRRRPLSYAAYTGFLEGVKYILTEFQNQAFKIDKNGWFPIHYACSGGYLKVVKEFFRPEKARLLLTKKGHNILHVAAASGKDEVVKYILRQPQLETLINMKDVDGNTPLHLASLGRHPKVVYILTWDDRVLLRLQNNSGLTALDIAQDYHGEIPSFKERLTWLSLKYAGVPTAPQLHYLNIQIMDPDMAQHNPISNAHPLVLNHNNITSSTTNVMVLDQQGHLVKTLPKKRKNKYKERINTLLVVATLVATVTFASGFSVPGGYNNNKPDEGMATLAHKCAFQVFVISNTIAMFSAILAAVSLIWAHLDDARLVLLSLDFALPLLGTALVMMSVAFSAGFYVVLHSVVFWLGVVVLVMGGVFLGGLLVLIIPLYSPTSCIRNKIMRYVFHVPFTLMLLACEKDKSGTHY